MGKGKECNSCHPTLLPQKKAHRIQAPFGCQSLYTVPTTVYKSLPGRPQLRIQCTVSGHLSLTACCRLWNFGENVPLCLAFVAVTCCDFSLSKSGGATSIHVVDATLMLMLHWLELSGQRLHFISLGAGIKLLLESIQGPSKRFKRRRDHEREFSVLTISFISPRYIVLLLSFIHGWVFSFYVIAHFAISCFKMTSYYLTQFCHRWNRMARFSF